MENKILNKFLTIFFTAAVTAILCFGAFYVYDSVRQTNDLSEPKSGIDAITEKMQPFIDEYSIYNFDEDYAVESAANAYLFYGLDGEYYARYFTPEEYQSFISDSAGNFTGVGIIVEVKDGILSDGMRILRVIGNSPAQKAGLKNEDRIVAVDGQDTTKMTSDETTDLLLGEENTDVKITVSRKDGETQRSLDFTITRSSFVQQSVEYEMLDNKIGHIRIFQFDTNATTEFISAITALANDGVKGIVFDVRDNPGGDLDTVCDMVDALVDKDIIAVLTSKDSEETLYSEDGCYIEAIPKAVLINGESASASELFSSALRDIIGVKLVGERSYGKGTGQTTYPLKDGSAVKLSTFGYTTKSLINFNGKGLEPDYKVTPSWDKESTTIYSVAPADDNQLQKAIEILLYNK